LIDCQALFDGKMSSPFGFSVLVSTAYFLFEVQS